MSADFRAVQWNRAKLVYDAILLAGVMLYIGTYLVLAHRLDPPKDLPAAIDIRIRAFGSCAFLMLTIILSIGPLARLNRGFLRLLYNRRHFGVLTFFVALAHAFFMVEWFAVQNALPNLYDEMTKASDYVKFIGFPFKTLGLVALIILFLMAATSHDYWLAFLTPPVWKSLHMAVYVAYGLVVMHVALGIVQSDRNPLILAVLVGGFACVTVLHLVAGWRERAATAAAAQSARAGSRSDRRSRSRTKAPASWRRRTASALRCSVTACRSARSRTFARTRTGRSARAASSTAA
jgi:DMSO/TMAO reductase YedYZ heme-binding membrane subunit